MLLLHQIGAVRVGEVVRYQVTYTPRSDRILPPPSHLHVKIKNASAIPLRAAYLHGPYTLYVACYPSTFDPNKKHVTGHEEGDPDYEPQLKAGGSWSSKLTVPEWVRQDAGLGERKDGEPRKSFTWVIEIASQVLFSTTAAVHYELLVGRDEKSVSLSLSGVMSNQGAPGRLEDHQQARHSPQPHAKGVFTKAIKLRVEDTADLWSTPAFPSHDENETQRHQSSKTSDQKPPREGLEAEERPRKKRKKIHLVIITHGLHSNLGADMLYVKESIDAAAKKAREDARTARQERRRQRASDKTNLGSGAGDKRAASVPDLVIAPTPALNHTDDPTVSDEEEDDEQVLVRGFNGNAVRTERGIQYLGKRLAKYALSITYPDQPYLPVKSTITQSISRTLTGAPKRAQVDAKQPSHKHSSIAKGENVDTRNLAYQITSISFIGHSLGGLVQTYAIAYIQKHSPEFFENIKPINFVALASPFLGLSNENPMYVRFALDFGLVGRTGRDLGLTWRAPTIARNGWGAVVGPFTADGKSKEPEPGAKPLLRILPTGPAHVALKMFRNRSVYSNVVNDGIVPLRTSCLLFLDWRGLGRVEKARRENGLVGTMVNWGLNELTGQNVTSPRRGFFEDLFADSGDEIHKPRSKNSPDPGSAVPQAEVSSGLDQEHYDAEDESSPRQSQMLHTPKTPEETSSTNFWQTVTSFFRPQAGTQKQASPKQPKIYQRGQTMHHEQPESSSTSLDSNSKDGGSSSPSNYRKLLVRGSSLYTNNSDNDNLEAPPKTTVFESAGDLLNPPLPPKDFILDPEARPRTIFHDRVYHPDDIPPPPTKRQRNFMRSRPTTHDNTAVPNHAAEDLSKISSNQVPDQGGMRIEEKIARAYHKDLSWRKVLVRLEPDAHNNIIVRRMFANAYGWPVIKHMCDTHFAYTAAAVTKDSEEPPVERAQPQDAPVGKNGERVRDQSQPPDGRPGEDPKAKRAATTGQLPEKDDHEIDARPLPQITVHAGEGSEKSQTRDARSPSELRESRDQISDLVSMVSVRGEPSQSYGAMHSGTAALHRLARQDSARWSDRFFESDEDEDDNDELDLNAELEKAYDRGIGSGKLKSSPQSTRSGKARRKPDGGKSFLLDPDAACALVAEPGEISRRNSRDITGPAGPPDPQTPSRAGLGLAVGLGRHGPGLFGEEENDRPSSGQHQRISDQVARARGDGAEHQQRPDLGDPRKTLD